MTKINIFVVESPLQALSAIEAKALDKSASNVLIVSYQNKKYSDNNTQLYDVVNKGNWDRVYTLKKITCLPRKLQKLFLLMVVKFLYNKKVSRLFMGEFRSEMMHYFRCALCPNETFLLDDGAVIINIQKKYLLNKCHWPNDEAYKKGFISGLLDVLFFTAFKNKKVVSEQIHLFSAFNIVPIDGQLVLENNYSLLKLQSNNQKKLDNVVYHFGSKYSEAGIISFEYELEFIKNIQSYFKDNNIHFVYVPHREESQEKLSAIKRLGAEMKSLSQPAEVFFASTDSIPAHISAAYSTVLNNLSLMFDFESVIAFEVDRKMIDEKYVLDIDNVYEYFKGSEKITVCDFKRRHFA